MKTDEVDLSNSWGYWTAAGMALILGCWIVFLSTNPQLSDNIDRVLMGLGMGLYFIGISLVVHGAFSQKKAFSHLWREIRALQQNNNLKSSVDQTSGTVPITVPINTEDIRREINLHAIEFKTRLNRIEEKIENSATTKRESSKMPEGAALIIGVLLGIWSGILGSISITAMFEMMKIGNKSIDPIVLILSFVLPILFLIWFTWKCWTTILRPAYNSKGITDTH